MHPSRVFLYICLSFVGGVFANSLFLVPQIFMWGLLVSAAAVISILWSRNKKAVVLGFCVLFFSFGIYRHQMFERPVDSLEYYKSHNLESQSETPNFFVEKVIGFKAELRDSLDSSLSPPQSSLLGAMILGEKERLSYDLKEKLNRSGTRHITAISGMHVIILANMLIGLGLILGMWRGQAFYFAMIFIILFIIMVGAPPSAIRAGIMGGILLFAQKAGRLSQAQRLLVFAATLMLLANPLLLRFDIGFQLSFLATLGIAMVSPWFRTKLKPVPEILGIRNTVSMTIPAVLFTAPILASNFGQLSLVSIFTNILVVPAISLTLGLGFVAGIAGIASEAVGGTLFWPVWLILSYVYKVIDISSRLPLSYIQIEMFPWYLTVLYFALLWWGIKCFKLER